MFVDNAVIKEFDCERKYDKFVIAGAIFEMSFKGAVCSFLESNVLNGCESCNLKYICKGIDEMVDEYIERTTVVTNSFRFDS
jgi:hypothetical protein